MNEIINALHHRRSVRQYNGQPIDESLLREILNVGLLAPTGDNFRSTQFILIRDPDTLRELAHVRKAGTRMLEKAGAAILVMADTDKTDLWIEDSSISMAYMHLAADSLGLGSCWIQMRARDTAEGRPLENWLRKKFDIPEKFQPLAILALGQIDTHPQEHVPTDQDWKRVHQERF